MNTDLVRLISTQRHKYVLIYIYIYIYIYYIYIYIYLPIIKYTRFNLILVIHAFIFEKKERNYKLTNLVFVKDNSKANKNHIHSDD